MAVVFSRVRVSGPLEVYAPGFADELFRAGLYASFCEVSAVFDGACQPVTGGRRLGLHGVDFGSRGLYSRVWWRVYELPVAEGACAVVGLLVGPGRGARACRRWAAGGAG